MSSLRLALKQSLEESQSGQLAAKKKREKERRQLKEEKRRRRDKRSQHPEQPKKRGPGRPRKHPLPSPPHGDGNHPERRRRSSGGSSIGFASDDVSSSSDENEFSDSSDHDSKQASLDAEGERKGAALFEDSDDTSDDEADYAAQKRMKKRKKQAKKQHKRHSAANRIQNHWKKKKGKTGGAAAERPKATRKQHSDEHEGNNQKAKKGTTDSAKASSSTKTKTVPPPTEELVAWMQELSTEQQRSNIKAGQRVKVRFVTKVKRDGKLIRRRKWYGGLLTGVSTGGSKIRIKYDDGTSEIAKFPDEDIVVDDEGNGRHRVPADVFCPPPLPPSRKKDTSPSPRYQSPPIEDDAEKQQEKPESPPKIVHSPDTARQQLSISSSTPMEVKGMTPTEVQSDLQNSSDTKTPAPVSSLHMPSSSAKAEATSSSPFSRDSVDVSASGAFSPSTQSSDSPSQGVQQVASTEGKAFVSTVVSAALSQEGETGSQAHSSGDEKVSSSRGTSSDVPKLQVVSSISDRDEPQIDVSVEKKPAAKPKLKIRLSAPKAKKETGKVSDAGNVPEASDNMNIADQISDEHMSVDGFEGSRSYLSEEDTKESTSKSDGAVDADAQDTRMEDTQPEGQPESSSSRQKRPSSDVVDSAEEPPPKRLHMAREEEEHKELESTPQPPTIDSTDEGTSVVEMATEGGAMDTQDDQAEESTAMETIVAGVEEAKSSSQADLSQLQSESVPISQSTKDKRNLENDLSEDSARPRPPAEGERTASSPQASESPTPLSSEPKQSTNETGISKPVSTLATVVKVGASEESERVKDEPVLTGSKNSAFDRKDSSSTERSGEQLKRLPGAKSGSDEETPVRSTTPQPEIHANDATGSSFKVRQIPAPRSGRRAAQEANQRIKERKEKIIHDPFAKIKRKKEKLDLKLFSHSASSKDGKRKRTDNSEDEEDDRPWVQCDNCSKWRILPRTVQAEKLPKHWYCEMNVHDPARSTCDAPEQTTEEAAKTKRKLKKRVRAAHAESPSEMQETAEDVADREFEAPPKESKSEKARGRPSSRSPPGEKKDGIAQKESVTPKPKRSSPTSTISSGGPDSPRSDQGSSSTQKLGPAKKLSALGSAGKKSKPDDIDERTNAAAEASGDTIASKGKGAGRGRRGRPAKDAGGRDTDKGKGGKGNKEAENQEWVQCEKCEKWRRLPHHVSADDLPEVWYCSMNTWTPNAASCDVEEEKADPTTREYNLYGNGGTSYGNSGKLSYRNLIFGTAGRKQNRPISERTRAAESLFNNLSDDSSEGVSYPTVMYANSSAFVSRAANKSGKDEVGNMSFFDLMSHSNLWAELRGGARANPTLTNGRHHGQTGLSFDELSGEAKRSTKHLVYHALGTGTHAGHEVLLEAQCREWQGTPPQWAELRAYCTLNVVEKLLCDLAKDGLVEIIEANEEGQSVRRYRRVVRPVKESSSTTPKHEPRRSRCMKIAKPWKQARSDSGNPWSQ